MNNKNTEYRIGWVERGFQIIHITNNIKEAIACKKAAKKGYYGDYTKNKHIGIRVYEDGKYMDDI